MCYSFMHGNCNPRPETLAETCAGKRRLVACGYCSAGLASLPQLPYRMIRQLCGGRADCLAMSDRTA